MEKGWDQLSPSYYSILGIDKNSSVIDIRSAYRKLAMQWHPDRWTRNPSLSGEAKRKFQQIQEAYSVLSDQRKRTMYDAGLYGADDEEEDEGFSDFLEEMLSLMAKVRRKGRGYSMEELQRMFLEMAQGFGSQSQWFCGASIPEHSKESKRARREANPLVEMDSRVSSLEVFRTAGFCS